MQGKKPANPERWIKGAGRDGQSQIRRDQTTVTLWASITGIHALTSMHVPFTSARCSTGACLQTALLLWRAASWDCRHQAAFFLLLPLARATAPSGFVSIVEYATMCRVRVTAPLIVWLLWCDAPSPTQTYTRP